MQSDDSGLSLDMSYLDSELDFFFYVTCLNTILSQHYSSKISNTKWHVTFNFPLFYNKIFDKIF